MSIVVGYSPHHESEGALELACLLARSDGTSVHALAVVPKGWHVGRPGDPEDEFERWAAAEGEAGVSAVQQTLAEHADVPVETTWLAARSVPAALVDHVTEKDAGMLVVGSGEEVSHGRIGITSKTDRLLHSSPVPVALAPRGYQAPPGSRVQRITFAFRGDDVTWALLERVANIARRTHACLRVVTFAIRGRLMRPSLVGTAVAEDMVLNSFVEQATAEQEKARAQLDRMGFPAEEYSFELSVGRSWGTAIDKLDWVRGEVLVVGSSSNHYLGRVFLGSSASKIVRHSPVPVVVVP